MVNTKIKELVANAENNILNLFNDDTAMKNYLEMLNVNPDLTYYAASIVDGAATLVDTYDGWKQRGYQVKSGEHGLAVFKKRKQLKRKFIDDSGKLRELPTASFTERQKIKNGDLKLSTDLSSYYIIEYLFSQKQTTAEDVNLNIEVSESNLSLKDIKILIEENTADVFDDVDFVLPNNLLVCINAYATYLMCLKENIPGDRNELFKQSLEGVLDIKESLSLNDKKLILNSVTKVMRSENILELLKEIKENVSEINQEDLSSLNSKKNSKIEDFGKKIGGARKDLWAERGLSVDDLVDMNLSEKYKYAIKNNVFKKLDYEKMVNDGLPVRVAYFIKTVRDAMPAKPVFDAVESNDDALAERKIKGYIQFVSELRDLLLEVKTDEDILNFYDKNIKNVYVENLSRYTVVPTEKSQGCLTNKLLKACQVNKYGLLDFDKKIKKKQFCFSEYDKKIDGFEIVKFDDNCKFEKDREYIVLKQKVSEGSYLFYYPKNEFAEPSTWVNDTYYILFNREIVANNLSFEEAKETVGKMADIKAASINDNKTEKKKRKSKFVPKQLEDIKRTGPGYGIDEENLADGDLYLNTFNFAGGEFGNWMSEKDRQASLNFGYDALMDLAEALEIEPGDISFGGELSIAFGSRGRSNSVAHYEPLLQVINLTKMRGAGSLAHEWGHALDNILSKKINGSGIDTYLTDVKRKSDLNSMEDLMHTIKYRIPTEEERKEIKCGEVKTDFYKNSIKFDTVFSKESKGYWQSDKELFARAFACYIKDKLPYKSDYLCGHADSFISVDEGEIIRAYPVGEEREAINKCFDKLIEQLKERDLLHQKQVLPIRRKSR